jgi:hypothetical protein
MAAGDTSLSICSDALIMLGANPLSSFSEGTTAATVADRLYDDIRTTVLTSYPWAWSVKKVQLAQVVTTPLNEWTYSYQLPTDRISAPRAVFYSASTRVPVTADFEIFGDKLYTNFPTVYIDYQYDPGESAYPKYLVQLLKYFLAWHFAEPVTDQISKAQYWQTIAVGSPSENGRGGFFRQATNIDAQANSSQAITSFDLVAVRG